MDGILVFWEIGRDLHSDIPRWKRQMGTSVVREVGGDDDTSREFETVRKG